MVFTVQRQERVYSTLLQSYLNLDAFVNWRCVHRHQLSRCGGLFFRLPASPLWPYFPTAAMEISAAAAAARPSLKV